MNINKHLIVSGILFSVVLFIWPVFMAFSKQSFIIEENLIWISEHVFLYKIQFFLAFLIGPAIIYLMISQISKVSAQKGGTIILGITFLSVYMVLVSIAYASQMILVPNLIENGMYQQAEVWYFASFSSLAYFLNQLGYFFWALGTLILFCRFLKTKGILKYISIFYMVSALLSFIAFLGLIINNKSVNDFTVLSGLLLIPIGILTIIWGYKENKILNQLPNQSV